MQKRTPALVWRILSRLSAAEAQEIDPWLRDDLQIARLILAHASRGDAVCCSPHVLATYEVLGLHPEKVWPKILERRKAWGPLEEIGALPKKPAQSVKLWPEQSKSARAVNSRAGVVTVLREPTISATMAAPSIAAAYPNSDGSGSEKQRPFFTVADIENFFETCPEELLSRRFRHFLRGCWIAAGRPFGSEILLFKANDHYRRACYYKSERTVRYNRLAAERLNLLEVVHVHHGWIRPRTERDKGLYRRVTTHRLPISLLVRWRHGRQGEVTPIRKPATPSQPLPPAPSAPLPKRDRPAAEHRSSHRTARKLTPREGPRLVNEMRRLMQGVKGQVGPDRLWIEYSPNDARYRAPMSQENALLEACMNLAIPEQSAREFLKLLPHDVEGGEET
jgi:hypothetical protein